MLVSVSRAFIVSDEMATSKRYYHSGEKEIIINAKKYFDEEKLRGASNDVRQSVKRTADCLGVSVSTVKRVCKEQREQHEIASPSKEGKGRPIIILDEFLQGA